MPDAWVPKLSENQVAAINWMEQIWWLEAQAPSAERVAETLGLASSTVKSWFKKDSDFTKVLKGKGIIKTEERAILTASQLMVVNSLLNLSDRRTQREKLEAAHVTPQTYAAWRRDPLFMEYMHKRAENQFSDASDTASQALLRNVEMGDMGAIKFYYEVTGKYNPKLQLDVNVDSVMNRVVEIIQKHVKDPDTLMAIADDLELLAGGTVREPPPVQKVIETVAAEIPALELNV